MARTMTVSDSIIVSADPETIYAEVSDPSLMGRWSPENRGATMNGDERVAFVGMNFYGHNKRGAFRWTTRCAVTAADPGKRFEFQVRAIGVKTPRIPGRIATWEYRFEQVPGGTEVTETWTDGRTSWPDFLADTFDKVVTGGHKFADFQRRNIHVTLRNLKREMETESE